MKAQHFPNLDWLRLLLAVQVVYIHAGINDRVLISPVPAFLAVSGFVVYGSIQRWPLPQFFLNRALRVLPLLFASFLLVGALFGAQAMTRNIIFWLWPFGELPVNAVVWSRIYEDLYYALLAVLFSLGLYRFWWFPVVAALVCITLVATDTQLGLPRAVFLLGGAFFLGNSFYIFREKIQRIPGWLATAIFVAAAAVISQGSYYAVYRADYAVLDFLSFAALLVFGVAGPRLPRLAVDLSYSIYLIHCIMRAVLMMYYMPLGWTLFWFMLLSTLPLCLFSWYAIEKPALKLKNWRPRAKAVPAE